MSACNHPEEIKARSVESGTVTCELCDTRSQRDDAVTMEGEWKGVAFELAEQVVSVGWPNAYASTPREWLAHMVRALATPTPAQPQAESLYPDAPDCYDGWPEHEAQAGETPRTDALFEMRELACQLERELQAVNARAERWEGTARAISLLVTGLRARVEKWQDKAVLLAAEIKQLRAQLAAQQADAQDAERYRWLRKFPTHFATEVWGIYGAGLPLDKLYINNAERLDAAINAALQAESETEAQHDDCGEKFATPDDIDFNAVGIRALRNPAPDQQEKDRHD